MPFSDFTNPSRQVQDQIADELERRRATAKRLRAKAEAIVTETKARMERMVLGEET